MKSLADRLGRDPNADEHVDDLQKQIDALAKRVKMLEESPGARHTDMPGGKRGK